MVLRSQYFGVPITVVMVLRSLCAQVELFISRDLDSRLSAREAAAVTEFLEAGAEVSGHLDGGTAGCRCTS